MFVWRQTSSRRFADSTMEISNYSEVKSLERNDSRFWGSKVGEKQQQQRRNHHPS